MFELKFASAPTIFQPVSAGCGDDMTAFKDELRRVGEEIGDFLKNDPFPKAIRPASLGEAVRDYPGRGGKRIRPALVLWACELFGGAPEQALPAAVALEIYHNWTLEIGRAHV